MDIVRERISMSLKDVFCWAARVLVKFACLIFASSAIVFFLLLGVVVVNEHRVFYLNVLETVPPIVLLVLCSLAIVVMFDRFKEAWKGLKSEFKYGYSKVGE
jgi:hypothetical protein